MSLLLFFGGDAPAERAWSGAGGIVFSGAGTFNRTHDWTGAGGLQFGGAGTYEHVRVVVGAGGLQLAGAGPFTRVRDLVASGGILFAGAGAFERVTGNVSREWAGSGGIAFAGAGAFEREPFQEAVGHAPGRRIPITIRRERTWSGTGGVRLRGGGIFTRSLAQPNLHPASAVSPLPVPDLEIRVQEMGAIDRAQRDEAFQRFLETVAAIERDDEELLTEL